MDIQEGLKKAAVEAAKARDQIRLDALRMATSALKYKRIEKGKDLSHEEILGVLATLCKQRRESIQNFEKGGRQDLVNKEKRELEVLLSFMPAQLSRGEIEERARKVIAAEGVQSVKEMGKVMKILTQELAGQAEGGLISQVVRDLLKS